MLSGTDAVMLLAACQDTAAKLLAEGPDCYLDRSDLEALRGFRELKEAGFAGNYDVQRLAGVSKEKAQALEAALNRLGKEGH